MMSEQFTIVGEEYVGYMQGNAYIIGNGECEFSLWERKEDVQKVCDYLNEQQNTISRLKKENEQLRQFINKGRRLSVKELMDNINENELLKRKIRGLEKENEELKRERDDWKSSTCSYMNKDSVLSMDCQIVQEALWELEKEIEFGSKREDLFFDLKEKFEKLNNHRIGVFE